MKKLTKIIPLAIIFIVCTNCSVNKDNQASNEFEPSDQLFSETMNSTSDDPSVAAAPINTLETGHVEISEVPAEPVAEPATEELAVMESEAPVYSAPSEPYTPETTTQVETFIAETKNNDPGVYTVRRGDTWMIIAQKLLGNPLKWRQIQKMNKEFKKSSDLYVGAQLTYKIPEVPVVEPEGLPYLIKNADTLPKISKKVYGTKNQWDVIYYNNREVIKSPDVIYSGFMIYYPQAEQVPMMKIEMAQSGFKPYGPRKPASVKTKK